MKICRVSRAFLPVIDGAANHVLELSKQQSLRGHDVWIIQPHSVLLRDLPSTMRVLRVGLPVPTQLIYSSKIVKLLFNLLVGIRIIHLHLSNRLDLIHAHGDFIEGFCQGIIGRMLWIPVVLTIHGGINQKRVYSFLAKHLLKVPNHIIVTSDTVKQQLLRLGLSENKISVISSGVNISQFQRCNYPKEAMKATLGISEFDKVIVSVGRLDPVKGFEYLISAVKSLLEKHSQVGLIIIGDGYERNNLLMLKGEEQRIILIGEKKREEVVDYLNCADVFALASVSLMTQEEGTPTSVMEAMAAGLPVVTTDSGGAKYLIKNGENGFIVPQRNVPALEEAISLLLEDDSLRTKIRSANQAVIQCKDWSVISGKILHLYTTLVKGKDKYAEDC